MNTNNKLYIEDFYTWTQTTAALIRAGKWQGIDPESLAEEVESLGKSQQRELASRLDVLLMHLLKWQSQPERRQTGHSWRSTIRTQRRDSGDCSCTIPACSLWWTRRLPTATPRHAWRLLTTPRCPSRPSRRRAPGR